MVLVNLSKLQKKFNFFSRCLHLVGTKVELLEMSVTKLQEIEVLCLLIF